jgi:hypothetical protein
MVQTKAHIKTEYRAHGSHYTLDKTRRVKYLAPIFPLFYQNFPKTDKTTANGNPLNPNCTMGESV